MLSVALAGLLSGSPALVWVAPPECPDADAGRALVAGYSAGRETANAVVGRVEIRAVGQGFRATVSTAEGSDVRTLEGETCDGVAHAAAVVIAVSLVSASESEPETESVRVGAEEEADAVVPDVAPAQAAQQRRPEPEPVNPEATREPTVSSPPSRARPRLRHGLGLAGGVAYGPAPAAAGVVRVGYRVGGRLWRVELDAAYTTPRRIDYGGSDAAGGRFQSASGAARGCGLPGLRRVAFPLCLGAEAGALIGQGFGTDITRGGAGAWFGLVAAAGVEIELTRWVALFAGGDLLVNLVRPAFAAQRRATLFRTPRLAGRGLLGLEFRFGG